MPSSLHIRVREDIIAIADEVCSTTAMVGRTRNIQYQNLHHCDRARHYHQMQKRYPDREFVALTAVSGAACIVPI